MNQAHCLIVGRTLSGKSTAGKLLVRDYRNKGIYSIVLDPLNDPGWHEAGAELVTTDRHYFKDIVNQSERCALFIDEGGEMIGRYNEEMFFLATRARHFGHRSHFITQRAAQLSPTVRDQCSMLYAFSLSFNDCKVLANEWSKQELMKAAELPPGKCLKCPKHGKAEIITIFKGE